MAGLVLLAACSSSSTNGHPRDPVYDVRVFLCGANSTTQSCGEAATDSQIAALRSALSADKRVAGFQFLSATDNYRVAQHVLPRNVSRLLSPGDLPPEFWVDLVDDADRATVARYAGQPGVDSVQPCRKAKSRCSVDVLRKVGIVH